MLDIKHTILEDGNGLTGQMGRFDRFYNLMKPKMATYLRLLATKNAINRASDYHYLNLAVTQSTEPVNGLDYIHPVVAPSVDYVVAVVTKSLLPNGELNFEFVPESEGDRDAARQATEMVKIMVNQANDPFQLIHDWVMDACLHKNGEMMICPHREEFTTYTEQEGTDDQLRAFEIKAAEKGLVALRTSKRKKDVDLQAVAQQVQQQGPDAIDQSVDNNTIYRAKYKLTGYKTRIKMVPIAQHYWICDPTVPNIQDQPFCGFYDPMTIQEATEKWPGIDIDLLEKYGEFSNIGAYQAGSLLNNLALHARDSVPINGLPTQGSASLEKEARQITVITLWDRFDIDGDGELELIEMVYSGRYIIYAKEVEFIPVANMCPKPLSQNFYGYSIAERTVPMHEYATAIARAEMQMAMYASTPRIGVNPEFIDLESLQNGESSIFVLDRKFDPSIHVWEPAPLQGNLGYVQSALERLKADNMAMLGMTTPQDVFNPEVMTPGNSGAKLQMALGPNQIIQDDTVKNCANGIKQMIWLMWRTMLQYGDDFGIKKVAAQALGNPDAPFLDYEQTQELFFTDRKQIHVDLAVGMLSEENKLTRQSLIIQSQQQFAVTVQTMLQQNMLTPDLFTKARRPFEDTLYTLGIKDPDSYLPNAKEVMAMAQQAAQAKAQQPPAPQDQLALARANELNKKAQALQADIAGQSFSKQLDAIALLKEGKATNYG